MKRRQSGKFTAPTWALLLTGFAAVVGVSLAVWLPDPDEAMPRNETPVETASFGNTATFVGTTRCAECHSDKALAHTTSGHSKTFHKVEDLPIPTQLDGQSYVDPVRETTLKYEKEGDGLSVRIPEIFGDDPFPLQYALGSGQHAFTFLTLVPGPGGDAVGIEHRVSLFSEAGADRTDVPGGALGLTPGQHTNSINEDVDNFGRIVSGKALTDCVRCHTTTAEIRGGEVANLIPSVGCESCHGPGSEHARVMTATPSKSSSAQPRHIRQPGQMFATEWSAIDEIRLCGQCHRMPEDVRSDRVTPYHPSTIRFQPIGLLKSRCFLESDRSLSCSGCHDPHSHASLTTQSDYVQTCLKCHSSTGKGDATDCPVSPRNNCIECHMPPVQIHPGVYFHDHWIRVRDKQTGTSDKVKTTPAHVTAPSDPID